MKTNKKAPKCFVEAPSRLELEMKILQTFALPLGYGAELER